MSGATDNKIKKRKKWPFVLCGVVAVVAIGFFAMPYLGPSSVTAADAPQQAAVQSGSIVSTVVSTGTLDYGDTADIKMPVNVDIDEVLAEEGDRVESGQTLATVDGFSIEMQLADVQEQLNELDEQINSAKDDSETDVIRSHVSGRVKIINAEEEEDASDAMLEHGSLMTISIDGKMAVDFESDASLSSGDTVDVKLADKSVKEGKVKSKSGNSYTVTLTDNGPEYGEAVKILDDDGKAIGEGVLYINNPISIAGYGGTINTLHVEENESVSTDSKLITLDTAALTYEFSELQKERNDLMDTYNSLVALSKTGTVTADRSGVIKSVNISEDSTVSQTQSGGATADSSAGQAQDGQTAADAASESPSGTSDNEIVAFTLATDDEMLLAVNVDELDILSVEEGMEAGIVFDAMEQTEYSGTIRKVANEAHDSSGVSKYTAEIYMSRDSNMRAGMNATATIKIEEHDNILTIPVDALQERGDAVFVYTALDPETNEPTGEAPVETGLSDGETVEILSGLAEGDVVYYNISISAGDTTGFPFGGGGMGGEMTGGSDMPAVMTGGADTPAIIEE